MTVQTLPYIRAKNREYSYSVMRNRFQKYSKRSILPYYESGVLENLSSIEERLYLSWIRQKMEKEVYKQILLHVNTSIALRESLPHSYNPVTDWLQVSEQVIKRPSVNVSYDNQDSVYTLLGTKGEIVLNKVISLIQKEAEEENWPLKEIEVCSTKDFEVNEWEYILMILHFNSTFEIADEYLCGLYEKIDTLADSFDKEGQEILQRDIYFDVRTFIPAD